MSKPPVRARDLRTYVHEHGYEKGMLITLELLLDEFSVYRHHVRDISEMQNKLIDMTQDLINIGDDMRSKFERLEKQYDETRGNGIVPDDNA